MESPTVLDLRIEETPSPTIVRAPSTRRSNALSCSKSPPKSQNVLDEKHMLMRQVLQDYGPYSPRKEHSCRSLPKPRDQDFVLRHNAQNIHDFKKEYSKKFGTLNRKPPQFHASTGVKTSPSREPIWKESNEAIWTLTEYGHRTLIQNELIPMATRVTLPSLSQRKLESPFKEKASIGHHIDLTQDESFAALVRQQLYSPRPAPQTSTAKARNIKFCLAQLTSRPNTSDSSCSSNFRSISPSSPHSRPYSSDDRENFHSPMQSPKPPPPRRAKSPLLNSSTIEIEPSIVNFHVVRTNHTYHFPVRVHNYGTKQERFRVRCLTIKSGGVDCKSEARSTPSIHVQFNKEKSKLAPGLQATLILAVTFLKHGAIQGVLDIETPAGRGGIAIIGTVDEVSR